MCELEVAELELAKFGEAQRVTARRAATERQAQLFQLDAMRSEPEPGSCIALAGGGAGRCGPNQSLVPASPSRARPSGLDFSFGNPREKVPKKSGGWRCAS